MTIVIDSLEQMESVFHDIGAALEKADYSDVLKQSQHDLAEQHAEMFAGQYDSNRNAWAPLAASTIKRKGHDRILVETGALRDSLVTIGGPGNVHEAMQRGMVFGTDVEYALFHQTGTSRMPARPPVGMAEETLDKLANRIADRTVEILVESGS